MEQLSPRLHHLWALPGEIRGAAPQGGGLNSRMASYRRVLRLAPEMAAYVAGLIDGEGTVTLSRHHAGENRRLVISVANTELRLLEVLVEAAGAGRITRKRTTSERHAPSFCYAIWSRQALDLLRQIIPYLRSYKRQRAEIALARYCALTPRNGRYTPVLRAARAAFEAELLGVTAGSPGRAAPRTLATTRRG